MAALVASRRQRLARQALWSLDSYMIIVGIDHRVWQALLILLPSLWP
jgi:hypothetical protein